MKRDLGGTLDKRKKELKHRRKETERIHGTKANNRKSWWGEVFEIKPLGLVLLYFLYFAHCGNLHLTFQ